MEVWRRERWEINKTVTYLPFSPRQAYTRHFSLLYLRSHPLPPTTVPVRYHPLYLSLSLFLPSFPRSSRYLSVPLFPLLFVSLRFRTPRTRDLKQLKRSAKHFNLASGASTPRANVDTHLFVSSSFSDLISPLLLCVLLVLSAGSQTPREEERERRR